MLVLSVLLNIGVCVCKFPTIAWFVQSQSPPIYRLSFRLLCHEVYVGCVTFREDAKLIGCNPPDWSGAIIFLIIAIISVLSYWFMRKRFVYTLAHRDRPFE